MDNYFFNIESLNICFANGTICNTEIPDFYHYLLHAILNEENKKLCFVFDKKPNNIYLLSILTSLALLKKNSNQMIKDYLDNSFKINEHVLMQPQGFVYQYGGKYEPYDLIKIKQLRSNDSRSIPSHEILRLQKTQKSRPAGKLDTILRVQEPTFIDALLNIQTYDNHSFIQNQIIFHTTKSKFNQFLSNYQLYNTESKQKMLLKDMKLWGDIKIDGHMFSYDTCQFGGEPLIAVSSEQEDIVDYLEDQKEFSKIVFFDNISTVSKHLQAFDAIIEKQRSVIFASIAEIQEIEQYLKGTGFKIWHLDNNDILFSKSILTDNTIFQKPLKKEIYFPLLSSITKKEKQLQHIFIEDMHLNGASDLFNTISSYSNNNDIHERIDEIIGKMFHLLFNNLIKTFPPYRSYQNDMDNINSDLIQYQSIIDPELYALCIQFLDNIKKFHDYLDDDKVTSKGCQIEEHICNNGFKKVLILSKDENIKNKTQEYFQTHGFHADHSGKAIYANPVCLDDSRDYFQMHHFYEDDPNKKINVNIDLVKNAIKSDPHLYDVVYVDHWPGKNNFLKLFSSLICRKLIFIGYKIEIEWFANSLRILNRYNKKFRLDNEEKSKILHIDISKLTENDGIYNTYGLPFGNTFDNTAQEDIDPPAIVFEKKYRENKLRSFSKGFPAGSDTVETRLVEYACGSFSWNQDSHEVAIITNINDQDVEIMEVKPVKSKKLQIGDVVMFRSNSEKSIITETASQSIGQNNYKILYDTATLWKKSLNKIGNTSEEIQKKLEKNGLSRHILTIKNWLSDVTVSPFKKEDLELILQIANDTEIQEKLEDIWEASRELKGLHIHSGRQLTTALINELKNSPVDFNFAEDNKINLEYGEIELYQINSISSKMEIISRQHANRIYKTENPII